MLVYITKPPASITVSLSYFVFVWCIEKRLVVLKNFVTMKHKKLKEHFDLELMIQLRTL